MSTDKDHLRKIQDAVKELVELQEAIDNQIERREKDRSVFIQSIIARTESGEELRLLTRDLSSTGVRLIGTHRLLGQKLTVIIPKPTFPGEIPGENDSISFQVRILWTCEVGDNLYENGGSLMKVIDL